MSRLKDIRTKLAERFSTGGRIGSSSSVATAMVRDGKLFIRVYPPYGSPRHIETYVRDLQLIVRELKLKGKVSGVQGHRGLYSCWYAEFAEGKRKVPCGCCGKCVQAGRKCRCGATTIPGMAKKCGGCNGRGK